MGRDLASRHLHAFQPSKRSLRRRFDLCDVFDKRDGGKGLWEKLTEKVKHWAGKLRAKLTNVLDEIKEEHKE